MPVNSGAITPTTVTTTSFTRIVLPTAAGSVMNRVCQYLELITAAGGADGLSSSAVMMRPARARTPSTW